MKNIDTAFRSIRLFTIIIVVGVMLLCGYIVYRTNVTLTTNKGKVYVMVNGKLIEAVAMERNIPVELRDHIRTFHTLFFTLSPDEKAIQTQISKALYLADGSARREYQNLKEAGYYNNIISGNISQTIDIDSIELDMSITPYRFRCLGRQYITRPTSVLTRSIVTQGYVRTGMLQSDNNSHGFLIERWEIVSNNDIKTDNR
ncbi:conjugative transposon protein TraK [Niabella beijingensis]|uniref:conjugative transposon protein TraK n=1 Tax=Niabella beijingensis TaxID=2872700 RepID=UPI001CBAA235|nr:conjugative transposon protein TraK [Niabella beijingensis]